MTVENGSGAAKVGEGGAALRHYTYYRPTIAVLLKQQASYGYELIGRMTELGFDQRMTSSLYGVLRDMESEALITSAWDMSQRGGPPRRVYSLTASGEEFLRGSIPLLARQREALGAMLDLYSTFAPGLARAGDPDSGPAQTARDETPGSKSAGEQRRVKIDKLLAKAVGTQKTAAR